MNTSDYANAPRIRQVTQISLPVQFLGASGRPLLEISETVSGGAMMRWFDPETGAPAIEAGLGWNGIRQVSLYGQHEGTPVAELATQQGGGGVCSVHAEDHEGGFSSLLPAKVEVGESVSEFRAL